MIRFLLIIFLTLLVAKVIELLIKFLKVFFFGNNSDVHRKVRKNKYRQIEDADFEDITDKKNSERKKS